MTPYYQNDDVTLYCGDSRDVLQQLDDTVDLIVTDPPYGQDFQSNRRATPLARLAGDDVDARQLALDVLAPALKRLRRGRHVYVFGGLDLEGLPLCEKAELIWDKQIVGTGDLALPWSTSHEPIGFYVYEISKANREKGYGRLAARMRRGSVIRVQRLQSGQVRDHPTEKPVMLLRQLIESSSIIGETVLDPFAGGGSTLRAAIWEGRRAIGIEVSEDLCARAVTALESMKASQVVRKEQG